MINTLDDYICSSMPQWGEFETNPNLQKKVSPEGQLLPFRGNTTVFLLEDSVKVQLRQLQESLYQAAPEMLAQPLQTSTFHMTLHDLVNGSPDQHRLDSQMQEAEERAAALIFRWKQQTPLQMKTTWLFNMVNTSIVLGLAPVDAESWNRLDQMYTELESVVPLGYALTPHITMAYFRPGRYSQEQVKKLSAALRKVDMDVTLHMDNLVLQDFLDMNHYVTIL